MRPHLAYVGWLSPEGDYHRCAPWGHSVWALARYGATRRDLAARGWIPLMSSADRMVPIFDGFRDLTEAQATWLLAVPPELVDEVARMVLDEAER